MLKLKNMFEKTITLERNELECQRRISNANNKTSAMNLTINYNIMRYKAFCPLSTAMKKCLYSLISVVQQLYFNGFILFIISAIIIAIILI